jgi:multiple sugar transport system substrate-binding protein
VHWDLVQYPQFKEAPNTGIHFGAHVALITSSSKVKDAAMRVISVMVSDEVQLDAARNGRISILKDPKMQTEFGKNLAFLKGKNVQAIFKSQPAKPAPSSEYDTLANGILNPKTKEIVAGKDVNTALRELVDQINQKIDEKK